MVNTKGAQKGFSNLPPQVKGILVVGGVALAYYIFRQVTSGKVADLGRDRSEDSAWNQEFDQLNQGDERTTLTKAELKSMANSLEEAFDGLGTDEQTVYDLHRRIKSDTDYAALQAVYGKRKIAGAWWTSPDFTGGLASTIRYDMDFIEIAKLNTILKRNGVKYRY
jgi:hypothetical protein